MSSREIYTENESNALQLGEQGPEYRLEDNHALLIGIDRYRDENIDNLTCAVNDIRDIRETLLNDLSFPEHQVHSLADEEATREGIEKKILQLRGKLGKADNLIIYFAGHGCEYVDGETGAWIPGTTGAWIPHDAEGEHRHICFSALGNDILQPFKTRHLTVFADCCYAGRMLVKHRSTTRLPALADYDKMSRGILTSGRVHKVQDRHQDYPNSPFAYYLKRFIQDTGNGDFFCIEEINRFLQKQRINSDFGLMPNTNNPDHGCHWLVRASAVRRKEQEKAQRDSQRIQEFKKRQELASTLSEVADMHNIDVAVAEFHTKFIYDSKWNAEAFKLLREVLGDIKDGQLKDAYGPLILKALAPESEPAGNEEAVTGNSTSTTTMKPQAKLGEAEFKKFGPSEIFGIPFGSFSIRTAPVTVKEFEEFRKSEWYHLSENADGEEIRIWRHIWTKQGVSWLKGQDGSDLCGAYGDDSITNVSWYEAVAYCNWLTFRETEDVRKLAYSIQGKYKKNALFRLPLYLELAYAASTESEMIWDHFDWCTDCHVSGIRKALRDSPAGAVALADSSADSNRVIFYAENTPRNTIRPLSCGARKSNVTFRIASRSKAPS